MFNTKTKETPIDESKPTNESRGRIPYRLNLTLNSEAKSELETLKVRTQKSSLVDVLRAALTVYKVIIDHQEAGGRVIFRKKDSTEETLRFV